MYAHRCAETYNIKTVLYSILKFQQSIHFKHVCHTVQLYYLRQEWYSHPRSHIQIQGAILMLGYWRNTQSFSKLSCASTINCSKSLRTKQEVLGTLVGISHPTPKSCNLKVSTQQSWAVLHNATLLQVAVRRLKRKALRASFMRTMQYLQGAPRLLTMCTVCTSVGMFTLRARRVQKLTF